VENAFKHGISLSRESFINIRIDARAEDGVVDFWCENSNFPKNSEQELSPGGIGLKNLHLRLSTIYKDHYHLQEGPSEDGLSYSTHLIIKTKN
jgi:sensor histidine kinase YesM